MPPRMEQLADRELAQHMVHYSHFDERVLCSKRVKLHQDERVIGVYTNVADSDYICITNQGFHHVNHVDVVFLGFKNIVSVDVPYVNMSKQSNRVLLLKLQDGADYLLPVVGANTKNIELYPMVKFIFKVKFWIDKNGGRTLP